MKPPAHLSKLEATVWRSAIKLVPRMTPQRVVQLEAYCIERARWLEAEDWIRANGTIITLRNDRGEVVRMVPAPQLKVAQAAQDRAIKLAKLLGLSERRANK